MPVAYCNKLRGRASLAVMLVIFSVKKEAWGWKGGSSLDFYLPTRLTNSSFSFRAMNSLIGFPPILLFKFITVFSFLSSDKKWSSSEFEKLKSALIFSMSR